MRHERRSTTMPGLAAELDDMVSVIERHRNGNAAEPKERRLMQTVTVMVWQEADGSETVTVVGDPEMTTLQMKGALHDGLYTVAHDDDEVRTG